MTIVAHASYCRHHVGNEGSGEDWCCREIYEWPGDGPQVDVIVEQPPDSSAALVYLNATDTMLTPSRARDVALALLRAAALGDQANTPDRRPAPSCPSWCRDHQHGDPVEPDVISHHAVVSHGVLDAGVELSQTEEGGQFGPRWLTVDGWNDINGADLLDLIVTLSKAVAVEEGM